MAVVRRVGFWKFLNVVLAAAFLAGCVATSISAQTPVQGRDYTNKVYRVVAVDDKGQLIVDLSGAALNLCTAMTPCIVVGPDKSGQPTTGNPVQVAGVDGGGAVRVAPVNTQGLFVVGPTGSGQTIDAAANPVLMGVASTGGKARQVFAPNAVTDADTGSQSLTAAVSLFNGASWDRMRGNAVGGAFVQGPAASGGASAGSPVMIGGAEGANVRSVRVDSSGQLIPTTSNTALGDGASNTVVLPASATTGLWQRVTNFVYNGTDWDRQRGNTSGTFVQGNAAVGSPTVGMPVYVGGIGDTGTAQPARVCNQSTAFTVNAATTTLLLAGVASRNIFICSLAVSLDATGTFSLIAGTGATCGTGTATIMPGLTLALGTPLDIGSGWGMIARGVTTGDSLCGVTTGAGAIAHGVLSFAFI